MSGVFKSEPKENIFSWLMLLDSVLILRRPGERSKNITRADDLWKSLSFSDHSRFTVAFSSCQSLGAIAWRSKYCKYLLDRIAMIGIGLLNCRSVYNQKELLANTVKKTKEEHDMLLLAASCWRHVACACFYGATNLHGNRISFNIIYMFLTFFCLLSMSECFGEDRGPGEGDSHVKLTGAFFVIVGNFKKKTVFLDATHINF